MHLSGNLYIKEIATLWHEFKTFSYLVIIFFDFAYFDFCQPEF
jgi:hypothetical protein